MKLAGQGDPQVSVLMTALDTAPYVAEAIESVLAQQTSRTWELLFVDDGSADETLMIVRSYARRHPDRIRVFTHPCGINRGISASRNLALRHARAPYVAFLDSDDVWLPHHLQTMTDLLDRMPDVAMVFAGAERWVDASLPFDEATSRASTWGSNYLPPLTPPGECAGILPRGRLLDWSRQSECYVPCICAVVVRTHAARAVEGFCEDFRGLYDDQAFHVKIELKYNIYAHDVCVARYGSTRHRAAPEPAQTALFNASSANDSTTSSHMLVGSSRYTDLRQPMMKKL